MKKFYLLFITAFSINVALGQVDFRWEKIDSVNKSNRKFILIQKCLLLNSGSQLKM